MTLTDVMYLKVENWLKDVRSGVNQRICVLRRAVKWTFISGTNMLLIDLLTMRKVSNCQHPEDFCQLNSWLRQGVE